ncbi:hypothetical protein [Metamycoplasma gateae]|uniref:Uncharacterized protein n=1 Tax=Metamycoplasma gateae TaxID=35769 RepID=A0ABZ2AIM8_9BACT|nr:hypothetical protein V2E26_02940 [Metamycoplasma gateae]
MSKIKKILLSVGLIGPTLVSPIISISCSDEKDSKHEEMNNELNSEIAKLEQIVKENKGSLVISKSQLEEYETVISKAKKIVAEDKSLSEKQAIINILSSTSTRIKSKAEELKTKSNEELLILAEEYLTFWYENIEETKLADAIIENIKYSLPKEFEFSSYKAVKNEETSDITIIYKLQKKGTEFGHTKNKSFELKGWAKTDEEKSQEAKEQENLDKNLASLKVRFLNEKAYQHVKKNVSITNFEDKPNFVVSDFDNTLYKFELSNLIKTSDIEYRIDVKLTSKTNENVTKSSTVEVNTERYSKEGSIFPHDLTIEQQFSYLESQLSGLSIYPYYSKDKTYLERNDFAKLTNKSYWLTKKNNQFNYKFIQIKDLDGIKQVSVEVSFADWDESPTHTGQINVDLSKLGVDELNKIRKEKGQDPVEDYEAPSATIDEASYEKIELVDFVGTSEDEKLTDDAGFRAIHDKILKNLKSAPFLILNEEVKKLILEEKENFLKAQHFVYDSKQFKRSSELFFYNSSKSFADSQNVLIFSNPIIENDQIKSIKLTYGSLSDIIAKDYTKISSTRIKINNTKFGENDLKKLELYEEIKALGFNKDVKYNGEYTKDDFSMDKLIYGIEMPEGFTIIKPTEFKTDKKKTKITVAVRYQKGDIVSYAFVTEFPISN